MPSAKLPRGAEYSYYGGVETKFPYVIFIPIVAFPLDLIFPPGSHQTGLARLLTVGSCTVLLAALFLIFLPLLRAGRRGRIDLPVCRKAFPSLLSGAAASGAFLVYTLAAGSDLYVTTASSMLASLYNAQHVRQIKRVLETEETGRPAPSG